MILSYTHQKGWCEKMHKKIPYENPDDAWRTGCPIVDKLILDLHPYMIIKRKE